MTETFLGEIDTRAPGLVQGLLLHGSLCWGEFFDDSDIDFVSVLHHRPEPNELHALDEAHAAVRAPFPGRRFEGSHCLASDLARPPTEAAKMPVHYEEAFNPQGDIDINLVTWHELAERGVAVRGQVPAIHTDLDALLAFTHDNLRKYWEPAIAQIDQAGFMAVGEHDQSVTWVTFGVARLHHLLARRQLTSKSGAGRYIVEHLDPRWHQLARDALRIRERPTDPALYDDIEERGRDTREFLAWAVADGSTRART